MPVLNWARPLKRSFLLLTIPVLLFGCVEGPDITEPTINLPLQGEYTVTFKYNYTSVEWNSIGVDSAAFVEMMVQEYGESRTVGVRSASDDYFIFEGDLPVRPTNPDNKCTKDGALTVYLHEGTYQLFAENQLYPLTTFYVPNSFSGPATDYPCVVVNVRAVLNR